MILDELLEFADAASLGTATGTVLLGDVIDLGATPQDFGNGKPMYLVIQITTAVTGTSATVNFQLASDAAAAIATDGSATVHAQSGAIPEASLVAGWTYMQPLPVGASVVYERYLGVLTVIGGTAIAAGAANAFLTFDPSYWKSYADATN